MGEHFVLLVDRLLTESTLEAIGSRSRSMQATSSAVENPKLDRNKIDYEDIVLSPRKIVECRICQDEDEDSKMETPCSCCGSLKYAHRRCVQRWCNEKGDTVCEICHQQFKPGYTAPPPLFQFGRIPMNFRGDWEISRRGSPRIIMVSTDRAFLYPHYDEYSASTARSVLWCRSVAFVFMVLLILRHTLPLILGGDKACSFPLVMLLVLRTVGIVLPIYVMVRLVTAIQRRRSQQDLSDSSTSSSNDEETEPSSALHPQHHIIHIPA